MIIRAKSQGSRRLTPRFRSKYPTLLAWRQASGLNQIQAAQVLKLSQSQFSRMERGVLAVRPQHAKRINEITGVPLDVLFLVSVRQQVSA